MEKCVVKGIHDSFFLIRSFYNIEEFFTLPVKSSSVGIYKVSKLGGLFTASSTEIFCKIMLLPLPDSNYCAIRLLHSVQRE